MMPRRGIPIVIAAPSGAGKTSLVKALVESNSDLVVSISHTTRPMRSGEKEGVNYHFVTEEQFEALVKEETFLEYAKVFGHLYGSSRKWLDAQLEQGKDVIFEIDWQGAQQVREKLPETLTIFILPPSLEILHERLKGRGQDSETVIAKRMKEARDEVSHCDEFDYLVVNDHFDVAREDLWAIIRSHRLEQIRSRESASIRELLANLLA